MYLGKKGGLKIADLQDRFEKLESQLKQQIEINQKLFDVIRMIEPYYVERYVKIAELINTQRRTENG